MSIGPQRSENVKLTLVKSDGLPDWYTIERAEHDGSHWFEPTEYGSAFMYAGRVADADVEGTSAEMLAIAESIEKRESNDDARRCAVDATAEPVKFWSPRNSITPGECSLAEADELAKQIRETLKGKVPA